MNLLYQNDCLEVLPTLSSESIDLIYLDGPFGTGKEWQADKGGFSDKWNPHNVPSDEYDRLLCYDKRLHDRIEIMTEIYSFNMQAYIVFMTNRLIEMRRVLKDAGSIYLHCDPTASHYLKVVMDSLFGKENFQAEIIWRIGWISGYKTKKRGWIRNHDTILYYTRTPDARLNFNKSYIPYPEGYKTRSGALPKGKGIPYEDTWNSSQTDILDSIMIKSFSTEKLGYPTQKPVALLDRIIKASSPEGSTVLDPFCGSGTSLESATKLGRSWIGIDASDAAISVVRNRLKDRCGLTEPSGYSLIK